MVQCSNAGSSGVISAFDRLSALPDGLIHTVLSFLPAPEVVRTCVLSQRWRNLWRSVPRITIDDDYFGIFRRDDGLEEKWAKFEDFATNLLLFHDNTSSLREFRLYSHVYNQRHVDRWIRRGIEYHPSVLIIAILSYPRFKLPPVVGSNFCHLKMLRLHSVDLGSQFVGLLCSACLVMEDLSLTDCEFSGNSSQAITSSTLKKLELGCCVNNTGYPLVITVPSLAYLYLSFGCDLAVSLCNMDSLVEAKIYIYHVLPQKIAQKMLHELLGSLLNVTRLELTGFEIKMMLFEKSDKIPIFGNMQTLVLGLCFLDEGELEDKLEVLGSFIQNAPCLEKLTLENCMFESFCDSESDIGRKNITLKCQDRKAFQCHKLKLIKVIYERDYDQRLVELVWSLERCFPNVNMELIEDDE